MSMATRGFFVTGTDTGCGKTEVSLGLIRRLRRQGGTVAAMKPVAAGATATPEGLRNTDALRLQREASVRNPYTLVNPVLFESPVAPHLAAARVKRPIDTERIVSSFETLCQGVDWAVVEGAGGWRVPLGPDVELADLAVRFRLPVVLVVGLRLGCLNHALLTQQAILDRGLQLAGWVANAVDPGMALRTENIRALRERIPAPCLGEIPFLDRPGPSRVAGYLRVPGPNSSPDQHEEKHHIRPYENTDIGKT